MLYYLRLSLGSDTNSLKAFQKFQKSNRYKQSSIRSVISPSEFNSDKTLIHCLIAVYLFYLNSTLNFLAWRLQHQDKCVLPSSNIMNLVNDMNVHLLPILKYELE